MMSLKIQNLCKSAARIQRCFSFRRTITKTTEYSPLSARKMALETEYFYRKDKENVEKLKEEKTQEIEQKEKTTPNEQKLEKEEEKKPE